MAQNPVPCLIFTGHAGTEHCLDLAKQNRIHFDVDGMTISPTESNTAESIFLSYSDYNHFRIGLGIPKTPSGTDALEINAGYRLVFIPETKSIRLESLSESPYDIGIYNTIGSLIATSRMLASDDLSVATLNPGVYIAVAENEESRLTLKFIIK